MHRNFQDEGLSIITSPSNPSHLKTSLPSLGNLNTNFFNEILHKELLLNRLIHRTDRSESLKYFQTFEVNIQIEQKSAELHQRRIPVTLCRVV